MSLPRISDLSLDEKIGQLFSVDAHGVFMAESSDAYRQLMHHVRDNHAGGIIWFQSDVYETALLNEKLQAAARLPLLVSADLEAGLGMRFADTTFWPSAMAMAATGDPSLAEAAGRVVAREARALGINHILAPVVDVNINPDNPVINTRSFGEDPAEVSRYATAFIRGVQSERVLATAKHFPGHGDTHIDSHRTLPTLHASRERLDRIELAPFRAAIEAKVASVMIGHLSVPALDPSGLPATVSKPIIDGVLRRELGFDGLVVSDAFDMGGLTEHFDAGEAAVRAIEAGEDQILMSPDPDAAIAAVKAAVKNGRIAAARIDESVRRIFAAKTFAGAPHADPETIFRSVDSKEHRDVANAIARRAVTLVRGALSLDDRTRVLAVIVSDFAESNPLSEFDRQLRARCSVVAAPLLDPRSRDDELPAIVESAHDAGAAIVAFAVRARSGAGQIAVPAAARKLVEMLAAKLPLIGVSFGSPYLIREVPALETYVCAYGIQPVMQVAVVKALFGEEAFLGRLPVRCI